MNRIAFITGATSGIGEATARLLAKNNYKLIVCGRRKERLQGLENELSSDTEIRWLNFDVRERDKVFESIESLPDDWKQIDVLINNAGNAHGLAPIDEGSVDDWDAMMDINVKGLLYVSKAILPEMVKRKSGHVINISSIAGKEVYPGGSIYCASKHAVDAINTGMRIDLYEHDIKVTCINPGLVNTEFSEVRFKGDKDKADNVYEGMKPLYGEDIAEVILFVLERPDHVNLTDITVFPKAQATATTVKRT